MTPTRSAWVTAAGILGAVAVLLWSAMGKGPVGDDSRLQQLVRATLLLGTPPALAGAILAGRLAWSARGRDGAERLVGVATAGLRGSRAEWGAAMRAELASVEDPGDRRRFALGCAMAAVRTGIGATAWLVAAGVGIAFALGTLVASRVSLAGNRAGILGASFLWPMLALFAVALTTAFATRSFRTGLGTGALSLFAQSASIARARSDLPSLLGCHLLPGADGLAEQILAAVDVAATAALHRASLPQTRGAFTDPESARRRKGNAAYVMSGARSCMRRSNWYGFVGDGSKSYFS